MQTWQTGTIIGKFYPPHRGHRALIETAQSRVTQLSIIVCRRPGETPAGELRAAWLQEMFPAARVLWIEDCYDSDDSPLWARLTIEWLGSVPDVVFTSEDYGEPYSRALGCAHVCVDRERVQVPISGTAVRADPLGNWAFLDPPVRGYYARRIVVLGAESTGTTTLARDLAEHFETIWVPEYGREYCEQCWTGWDYPWRTEEFVHIAGEQAKREGEAARNCNKILICDTDAFATRLWHWRHMGFFAPEVDEVVFNRQLPALYLLTGDEIPFVQDGWRDGEAIRHEMHAKFEEELEKQVIPWHKVRGTREERVQMAIGFTEVVCQ